MPSCASDPEKATTIPRSGIGDLLWEEGVNHSQADSTDSVWSICLQSYPRNEQLMADNTNREQHERGAATTLSYRVA